MMKIPGSGARHCKEGIILDGWQKRKRVGLEVRLQVSSVLLPGSLKKGIMAGDSQATDQIKKFLKIKLSIRVEVQFLHHAVKDTRILLILQR